MEGHQVVVGGQMSEMDGHGQQVVIGGQMEIHGEEIVEHETVAGNSDHMQGHQIVMGAGHTVNENGQILDANGQIVGMVHDGNMVMGVMDDSMMTHSRKKRHDEFMPRHAAPLYCGLEYGPNWIEAPSSGEMIDGSSGSVSFILTAVSSSRVTQINCHGPRGLVCGSLTETQVTSS